MGSSAENGHGANARLPVVACPVDELARRKGVHPVRSADDLACNGIFETDEELDEFLAHVAEMRRADPA
jgi:hypothetical protein